VTSVAATEFTDRILRRAKEPELFGKNATLHDNRPSNSQIVNYAALKINKTKIKQKNKKANNNLEILKFTNKFA
jgi:hypothetical protein